MNKVIFILYPIVANINTTKHEWVVFELVSTAPTQYITN